MNIIFHSLVVDLGGGEMRRRTEKRKQSRDTKEKAFAFSFFLSSKVKGGWYLFILGMKSSIGVAVRMAVGVSVLFVDFAVGVTVAVAVGMPVAVPIAGVAIRVSVTVTIGFQSIGSSGNLHFIQQTKKESNQMRFNNIK